MSPVLTAQSTTVHSQNAAPRQHHLFVGAELLLLQNDELVPIRRLKGNSALLADPVNDYVAIRDTDVVNWRMTPKVASVLAEITDLRLATANSAEQQLFADQVLIQAETDRQARLVELGQAELARESEQASVLLNSNDAFDREQGASAMAHIEEQSADLEDSLVNMREMNEAAMTGQFGGDHDETGDDTLELTFDLSAPVELPSAYVFVTVRIWADDRLQDTNFHRHVSNIGPEPRKVNFIRPGYPPGFEIRETKIYLFSHGEEIPTNLSEKRYPLTYQEAKEFLNIGHMGEHRRETVVAQPAWSLAPPALLQYDDPRSVDYPVTVDLDETGAILAFRDTGQVVPDHIRDLVNQLTFIPALENGTPVPSTLQVNPADFFKE